MLCREFEEHLTDYLDRSLPTKEQRAAAEHVLRCPVCHDLLSAVKTTLQACRMSVPPMPSAQIEARIMQGTAPEFEMTCHEFEEHLTDYLDGFLPAPLYQRWQRHAALCTRCTELPGEVVRSIGACYSYLQEERLMPEGLHERILQATLGTTNAHTIRASLPARIAAWWQGWIDALAAPQLATMATMILMAMIVGTTAADNSTLSNMYRTSLRMAAETYARGASTAARGAALSADFSQLADEWADFVSTPRRDSSSKEEKPRSNEQTTQPAQQQR